MAVETAEPAEKRLKTAEGESAEAPPAEAPPAAEPPKELELDAPASKAATIKEPVVFHTHETTLNVLPGPVSGLLKAISDGGFQYLLAGARSSVGLKNGRYMFEAKIIELVSPVQETGKRSGKATQVLRIGFAASGGRSSLFLGDAEDSICFDMDGFFTHNKRSTQVMPKAGRDTVLAVVLNLDATSANANTVSLFRDGVRACPPQPLPEALRGVPLFPTVTFRNVTAFVNLGSSPLVSLPFRCRTVQDAEQKHAIVTAAPSKGGKHDVVFPVCLPDEGTFDWADLFLEKNPDFTEFSDRMILAWAEKSGLSPAKGGAMSCLDKPETVFNLPFMDDGSVRHILQQFCPIYDRNFLVLEVKGGLVSQDRAAMLALWPAARFRRVAKVLVGEPTADFKKRTAELILKDKQIVSNAEFKLKKAREKASKHQERVKKVLEKQQRKMRREQKKAEKERIKAFDRLKKAKADAEAKAQREAEEKTKDILAKAEKAMEADEGEKAEAKDKEMKAEAETKEKDDKAEAKDEEMKAEAETKEKEEEKEEAKESAASESEKSEEEEEEVEEADKEEPPRAELTAEDKKVVFQNKPISDLTAHTLSTTFAKFTLPEKGEGFDEITYDWTMTETKSQEYLKAWILGKKQTTRIEELKPSPWFNDEWNRWQKEVQVWRGHQNDYQTKVFKAAADKQARSVKALAEKHRAEQSAKLLEARKAAANKKLVDAETEESKAEAEKELKAVEEAQEAAAAAPKPEEEKEASKVEEEGDKFDFEDLDVFGVEDVSDVGDGIPLCRDFGFEDWAMLSLRFEIQLLAHAFIKDADDTDRTGIYVDHLAFYYQKYFKKPLNLKYYGIDSNAALLALIDDAVNLRSSVITSRFRERLESLATFMMLTEEARRYRCCRLDLGEEDARLKIVQQQAPQTAPKHQKYAQNGDKGAHSKGGRWQGGYKELEVRLCYECNEPGHEARNCPLRATKGGKGDDNGGRGVTFPHRSGQESIPIVRREPTISFQQPGKGAAKGGGAAKGLGKAVLSTALAQAGASPAQANAVAAALQAAQATVHQQEQRKGPNVKGTGKVTFPLMGKGANAPSFQAPQKGGKGKWAK